MPVLTVATFNVHHCRGADGTLDVERTASVIVRLGADVIALQELDRHMERSGRVDQPAVIADLTGLHVRFFATIERGGGEYGVALAAREPIEPRLVPLPRVGAEEPRAALVSRVRDVSVVSVHLSTDRRARALQVAAVASLASRLEGDVVLLGDFNAELRSLDPLVEAGLRPAGERLATHRGRFRSRQIDHVFLGGGLRAVEVETHATDASDHLPLVAEIHRIPPQPT